MARIQGKQSLWNYIVCATASSSRKTSARFLRNRQRKGVNEVSLGPFFSALVTQDAAVLLLRYFSWGRDVDSVFPSSYHPPFFFSLAPLRHIEKCRLGLLTFSISYHLIFSLEFSLSLAVLNGAQPHRYDIIFFLAFNTFQKLCIGHGRSFFSAVKFLP